MAAEVKCGIKVPSRRMSEVREFDVSERRFLRAALVELGNDPVTFSNLPFRSLSPADAASLQLKWNITIGHDSIEVRVESGSSYFQGMAGYCSLDFEYSNPSKKSPGMCGIIPVFPVPIKCQKSCSFTWEKEWLDKRWYEHNAASIRVTLTVELISAIEVLNPEGLSIAGQGIPLPVSPPVTFDSYFLSNFLSDFSISSGAEVWPVHKMVLAAGSEVFKRMFQSEMKEAKEGRLNIPDADPEAVKQMMTYLYKGCYELEGLNSETLFDLFKLADMYDIEGLRGQTLSKIVSIISVENAPEMYTLAQVYGQNGLMEKSLLVVKSNREGFSKNPDHLKKLLETFPDFTFKVLHDA